MRLLASDVIVVRDDLPLLDAASLTVNPCTAWRMLHDFRSLAPGESTRIVHVPSRYAGDAVVQNGATSAVGRYVIQLCRAMGVASINIIRDRSHQFAGFLNCKSRRPGIDAVKSSLHALGSTAVYTEDEISVPSIRENIQVSTNVC